MKKAYTKLKTKAYDFRDSIYYNWCIFIICTLANSSIWRAELLYCLLEKNTFHKFKPLEYTTSIKNLKVTAEICNDYQTH